MAWKFQISQSQHVFRYQSFHINKSQPLGRGSYGAVYKAKCDQLPCAAKILHPTILDPTDPGAGKIMERFQQECKYLESIRHPNIVQYLGMTRDPESRLPVLLMELLDESLTKMLECSQQSLAYYVQVDICHDIALAVAYLHSNDIIHRDLSSNNVLIMAKSRAKVTDFGMCKLASTAPSMTPLTMCPGTLAYMPPEALREPPVYTKKLDCFSEGVIMIQVCTRLWPEPGPRTKLVPYQASPTGMTEMPVLEPERRKNHIDMIDHSHALLPIAMDCLRYQENERPSSEELCEKLAGLKETSEYRESAERMQNDKMKLEKLTKEMRVRETATAQQLHKEVESQPQQLHRVLQEKDSEIQQKKVKIFDKIVSKNDEIRKLHLELQTIKDQPPQMNDRLYRKKSATLALPMRQRFSTTTKQESYKTSYSSLVSTGQQITLGKWKTQLRGAPFQRVKADSVVIGDVAYFLYMNGMVCSYNSRSKDWRKLPSCPLKCGSLADVGGLLTAIGGSEIPFGAPENKLYVLTGAERKPEWMERFPPMPTKRYCTSSVSTKQHLIVAGGIIEESNPLNTVEVMDIETLFWSKAASLPHTYSSASATICGDYLYLLGGVKDNFKTKSVLTCSLTELLQSCSKASSNSVWHRIADFPVFYSTCASINGELVAVGGVDDFSNTIPAIHKYDPTSDSWSVISNMPTARHDCFVAILPTNKMMVVGGCKEFTKKLTDKTETVRILPARE